MAISPSLAIAVVASALFAAGALLWLVLRTFAFCPTNAGRGWKGVGYAFSKGMLPWEKESAGRHRLTLAAGTFYHVGILVALLQLFTLLAGLRSPEILTRSFGILVPVSLVSGVALLVKRAVMPTLRALSSPDDYAANVIVDLFLLLSFLAILDRAWVNWLAAASIPLFLYLPIGKIRHCVFFFYTRGLFGLFFGRRGVLPHPVGGGEP
jgi:nitrate reductase gamma subunit